MIDALNFGLRRAVPLVFQAEASECGLACLAMVAGAHGHETSLQELRQRHAVSLKGASLHRLMQIAEGLGLAPRPLRLELEELGELATPCILHWDLSHFVVLVSVSRGWITLHDPAIGRRRIRIADASKHFTGVALELKPAAGFVRKRAEPGLSLRSLFGKTRGLVGALATLFGLSLGLQALVVAAPFYMQWVVDHAVVAADRDLLVTLAIGFALLVMLQTFLQLARQWAVMYLSSTLSAQWNTAVFRHLVALPLNYFAKRSTGDLVSRMASMDHIQRTLNAGFVEALIDGLMAAVTLAMMFLYSPMLAAISLAVVVVYLLVRVVLYGPMRRRSEEQLLADAKLQGFVLETLRGITSVKLNSAEPARAAGYQDRLVDSLNHRIALSYFGMAHSGSAGMLFGLERVVVIALGAWLAMEGAFSIGMLFAYLAYKDLFSARVNGLIEQIFAFRLLRLHAERLGEVALAPVDDHFRGDAAKVLSAPPAVEAKGLAFRYAEAEPWIFEDVSFSVAPGETVAIVGPSGCGKSSLLKLLLGIEAPAKGEILIEGVDLRSYSASGYRAIAASVLQDDRLFAGTIMDNITFFEPPEPQRVEAAARLAGVHADVEAMPMGYQSIVGDMGSALSSGQQQRVLLARALYRRPKLLILDEATSHLDVGTERLVNDAIARLRITKIIVAHRPETIACADRVLRLEAGRLVQEA